MKRHINTAQMKEKGRNSSDQINKEEITSLPEREFSILIVTVLKRLENRMEKGREREKEGVEKKIKREREEN